jgi:NhaP-type Na+/H+ or K+/H+ antiporter
MFLLGRLLALTWLDTLRGANPYAIALFSLVVIMVSYLPANNQVLQGPESLVAFFALLVIWAVTRRPARAALPLPAHGGPTPSVVSRAIGA